MNLPDHIHPIAVDDALLNIGMTINEIRALTGDPTPQIIRTPAELEALESDAVALDSAWEIYFVHSYRTANEYERELYQRYLPAVVVASGEHVRACREALEGDTP